MSNIICQDTSVQVLEDKSSSGKVRPWALHKHNAVVIAEAYTSIDMDKAERVFHCADVLTFRKKDGGGLVLHDARFCRVRLCPICQWRRAMKTYTQMRKVLEVAKNEGYQFIMLTLTMRNCEGSELSESLDRLMLAFNRLSKYKEVKQAVKGWYRGCEVTHNNNPNSPSFDTFHPHLHVILAVNKSYFSSRYYIKRDRWLELWQKALQVDYDVTQLDVRKCYGGVKAVSEAVKYTVKSEDIISDNWQMTVDTLAYLDTALNNRRFMGLGGVLKEIHKKLNLDDVENGDLLHVNEEAEAEEEVAPDELIFFWNGYNQRYER